MADEQSTTPIENWKPIPGYEGLYEASDLGRVRYIGPARHGKALSSGGILRQGTHTHYDYHFVSLNGKKLCVHAVICSAFHGPCPDGMECCHGDGNGLNNRAGNLRWDTRKANWADRKQHGRGIEGRKNPKAKLTPELVLAIRKMYRETGSPKAIAAHFGVPHTTAMDVGSGRTWKSIPDATSEPATVASGSPDPSVTNDLRKNPC